MKYIMVWVEEEEKWYYFINDFQESIFPNGYVDYYIEVEDGIIKSDSWHRINVGRKFSECYSEKLWQTNWDSAHSQYKKNKQIVVCLNCSHEQELKKVYNDDKGDFTVCEECEASYDVDIQK